MDIQSIAHAGTPIVVGQFLALLALQAWHPLRAWVMPKLRRLGTNVLVGAFSAVAAQLAVLPAGLWVTRWAEASHFGLLHWVPLPGWLAAVASVFLMDYTFYYWHRWNHQVAFLWRFHNVHHADADLDVTTALRFHFGEIVLSTGFRLGQLGSLGVSTPVFLVFELIFGAAAQFHHSNWRLPFGVERALNRVIVTPRMHGLHHSIVRRETDSNYSTIFCWWDRLHGSFTRMSEANPRIGVPAYLNARHQTLPAVLLMPFQRQKDYWAAER